MAMQALAGDRGAHVTVASGLAGRIGPNAVTRLAEALDEHLGEPHTSELFRAAGQLHLRHAPPLHMVEENVVTALHAALRVELGLPGAARIGWRAGSLTGDYLLANRIPGPVRALLRMLPATWASRILVRAMEQHSWTFAGSGTFAATHLRGAALPGPRPAAGRVRLQLSIHGCPLCRGARAPQPVCDYFAATFERLFAALVHSSARVCETACRAGGADACTFEVRW